MLSIETYMEDKRVSKWSKWNKMLVAALSVATVGSAVLPAYAETTTDGSTKVGDEVIQPVEAGYGYYVDVYQTNSGDNMSPESNAAIGVLPRC